MESHKFGVEKNPGEESFLTSNQDYKALDPENQETEKSIESFADFSQAEQEEILYKQKILSSLAYFIGKDFHIPVELNKPGAGWHWDFKNNVIKVDPKDLLEKSMDILRFIICHEGGHRRISRTDFIPTEEWRQRGFSFMMNAIEDGRDNNFVSESYPKFAEQMVVAYNEFLDYEAKAKELSKEKLGQQPRFMKAGFEYLKQWFKEVQGQDFEISEDLPEEVKDVVNKTLKSAQGSWLTYPSRKEADMGGNIGKKKVNGETMISEFAKRSYEINRDEVWPEFKKLVEADTEDQKMQEALKGLQKNQEGASPNGQDLPKDLQDKLTEQEQEVLKKAIKKALGEPSKEDVEVKKDSLKPVDLDVLSKELKQKIKEYVDSLPKAEQKEMEENAKARLKEFEDSLNEELQGKLLEKPEDAPSKKEQMAEPKSENKKTDWGKEEEQQVKKRADVRKKMETVLEKKEKNTYEKTLEKVADLVDKMTADLRDVFIKRKEEKYESGYRSGRRWNIRKRIREKIEGIPLFKTEAREQPESESEEMDYAITLMVDLSGSMNNNQKIQEAFKSAVILAETLNNLGVKFEIVGFQDILLEFKSFDDHFDEIVRGKMGQMILEVGGQNPGGHNNPSDNNDGACLKKASEHLEEQMTKNKVLFVISDGIPETRDKSRSQLDKELKEVVAEISSNTRQKIVGLGLNSDAVKNYYPNNISGVDAKEMAETLAGLLREVIEKY
jgi:cation transport regulator ChaB/Mg-chelatase subunit ChlD